MLEHQISGSNTKFARTIASAILKTARQVSTVKIGHGGDARNWVAILTNSLKLINTTPVTVAKNTSLNNTQHLVPVSEIDSWMTNILVHICVH